MKKGNLMDVKNSLILEQALPAIVHDLQKIIMDVNKEASINEFYKSLNPIIFASNQNTMQHVGVDNDPFDNKIFDKVFFKNNLSKLIYTLKFNFDLDELSKCSFSSCYLFFRLFELDIYVAPNIFYSSNLFKDIISNNVRNLTISDLHSYTLFDSNWYDEHYLCGDIYKGRPELHFLKHGKDAGLMPAPWISADIYKRIINNFGSLGVYYDTKYAVLDRLELLPTSMKLFDSLIVIDRLQSKSLGFLAHGNLLGVLPILNRVIPNNNFLSISDFFRKVALNKFLCPKWFLITDYLEVNPDITELDENQAFSSYIIDHIHQHRALSKQYEFAPKDLLELDELVQDEKSEQFSTEIKNTFNFERDLVVSIVIYNNSIEEIDNALSYLNLAIENTFSKKVIFKQVDVLLNFNSDANIYSLGSYKNFNLHKLGDGKNIGFGAAHNKSFKYAKNNLREKDFFFLILNPDGVVHPDSLLNASDFILSYEGVGVFELIHMPIPHPKRHSNVDYTTLWFSGAAAIIDNKTYESTGGFDENIFLYSEDLEYSIRLTQLGVKIRTMPKAVFWHDTHGRQNEERYSLMLSSALYICKKYSDMTSYIRFFNELKKQDIPKKYRMIVQKNLKKTPKKFGNTPFYFRDFHLGPARRFNV